MTGRAPDVTVVIATRNRRAWLEECLRSVQQQEGVSWECVVVDDASTDGTAAWLDVLGDPRVRTIRQAVAAERSAARNRGLAEARGRYVMFLDDDDRLWPRALRVLASGLGRRPDAVAAVGARLVWFTAEGYERRDAHPRIPRTRRVLRELLVGWSAVSGQSLYRAAAVRRIAGYDPGLTVCEDRDLWLRLAPLGPVVLRPEIVMTYRIHPQQRRPPDLRRIRERVARRAIRLLPRAHRRHALRLRLTNRLLDEAEDELSRGSLVAGAGAAVRALLNTPAIFLSPLIGEWVIRRLMGRVARRFFPPLHRSAP